MPPGAPDRPPTDEELLTKLELCAGAAGLGGRRGTDALAGLTWVSAGAYLRSTAADG